MASGISGPSLGALAPTLCLLIACGGQSTKPGPPAQGGAGGEPAAPPAGECSFSQGAFTDAAARPRPTPPALVAVPDGLLTAWVDDRGSDFGLYGQVLSPEGAAAASEVQVVSGSIAAAELALSWSEDRVALAWSDEQQLHLSLLDSQGALQSADVWLSERADYTAVPRLAAAGRRWGLVWQDGPGVLRATSHFVLVGQDGAASEPLLLAPDSQVVREPQLCFTGQHFGVVWNDRRSGQVETWFRVIDAEGVSVTVDRRVAALEGEEASQASIACDAGGFAIAWNERLANDEYQVRLQRLDAQGDSDQELQSFPGVLGAVAFNGRELQLLRYASFGVTELWLERLAGGAQLSQRLSNEFGGMTLRLPLVARPQRSVIAWSDGEQLWTARFECP